ncbi:uncharacterized protein C8Q71DRAFT_748934 [Rhodofomes roseus]|uniref:Uncharacterized protein n=1 Tax=Rhodofomes roseus TaxID=34475 RepID=A0ABQ8KNC6_9APHY|nr:uncharacterized protein C8Q71DRAFT_748934 [Rhodofomes roseus]KAH9839316.1 hypothetical protein C8Q71DRAFT_748934 [Rhodofomes roseus]
MFPRGPRFPAAKIPEVPGPNAYNPQDPEYDAYKRGAFLEKTNRFSKDKPSEIPGPGAYNADAPLASGKPGGSGQKTSSADRYAVLQRKLEDLERVHTEGKKAHGAEVERLKLELNRAQRSSTEHSERADKLKKQNDALENRAQELKKTSMTEQSELRELRTKLKATEHERTQLAAKQGEAGETKKALQAAEARRKDDVRERDRKIVELEKALASEKKRRELVEGKLTEVKSRVDAEVNDARAATTHLETQLESKKAEAHSTKAALDDAKVHAAEREEELLNMLEQHRATLSRVAHEYGQLASRSVSQTAHSRIKHEADVLKLRVHRLERKLANSEGQVVELANLIRQTKDENSFLATQLREAQKEVLRYAGILRDTEDTHLEDAPLHPELEQDVERLGADLRAAERASLEAIRSDLHTWTQLDRLRADALLLNATVLLKAVDEADEQVRQRSSELSASEVKRDELQKAFDIMRTQHADTQEQLARTSAACDAAKTAEAALRKQLEDMRAANLAELSTAQQALQKEKDTVRKFATTVQQHRAAEEALRAEMDQMSAELAEAERYREAYGQLVEEVDALVARNALAENEASRLSKFNAEIVGHNNPAQRIMYVDRIRRELHETKQELLILTRDRDATQAYNEDLQHELDLYKSVAVPPELKPRTTVTRVERLQVPSASIGLGGSQKSSSELNSRSTSTMASNRKLEPMPEVDYDTQGEMTLDEIL